MHDRAVMRAALDEHFRVGRETEGPYLFRRLAAALEPGAGPEACRRVLAWERQLIESRAIRAIGWRAVAIAPEP